MLTTLAIAALFGGYVFGMRFRIYILIPAVLLSLLAIVVIGLALDSAIRGIIAAAILAVTGLQVGYLAATTITIMLPRGASQDGLQKLRWRKEH